MIFRVMANLVLRGVVWGAESWTERRGVPGLTRERVSDVVLLRVVGKR